MSKLTKTQKALILSNHRVAHAAGYAALRERTSGRADDVIDYVLDDGSDIVAAITWDYGVHHPIPELCSPGMGFCEDL